MASTRSKQDLTDVLGDTLDEFEGGNGDVAGLVRDVGTTIDELAPQSDPGWISELRRQCATLAEVNERKESRGDWSIPESDARRIHGAFAELRRQLEV